MSRTARQIAETGLSDLYRVQEAFNDIHALFLFLKERLPAGHFASDVAELGMAVITDHSDKAWQWAECMENELDDLGTPEGCAQ